MPHYVTKLWKKNYWHELRSVRVIAPITMTVIFFGALGGVATEAIFLIVEASLLNQKILLLSTFHFALNH